MRAKALKSIESFLPYFIIAGFGLFMFRDIFARGYMSGYDNSFHLYDAYYLVNTLMPKYHWISGWSMKYLGGFPVLVDYYQTGFFIIACLTKLFFIPLNLSYKLAVLASYLFLGMGFYKFISNRFGIEASLPITIALMLQKDIYCDRILGGIWSNYLALGIFFIFFHILDRSIDNINVRRALGMGLLLGLIILTHLYVAVFSIILLVIYFVPYSIKSAKRNTLFERSIIYLLIPVSAALVSSYYLYGFLFCRYYFSRMPAKNLMTGLIWTAKSFFGPIEKCGNIFTTLFINVGVIFRTFFSIFGLYIFLIKEKFHAIRRLLWVTLTFIFISLLLFSDLFPNLFGWWQNLPFLGNMQSNRFLIYIHIGMYLIAAYGVGEFIKRSAHKVVFLSVISMALILSASFHYLYIARDVSRTLDKSPNMQYIYSVLDWVNGNVPADKMRVVYESTIGNTDDPILARSDVFALSGIFTNVSQIGVARSASPFPQEHFMRLDHGNVFEQAVQSVSDAFISDRMKHFNAGYIITAEKRLRDKLKKSRFFTEEKIYGLFSIFRLKDFESQWVTFKWPAEYEMINFDDQHLIFDISNKDADNEALIKVAYHPFWNAHLNGVRVKIDQDTYGFMKIMLPEPGQLSLDLSFNSFKPVWVLVSLISLATALFIIVSWKKDGRSNAQI